jgi:multiple antibiotic resistance protein
MAHAVTHFSTLLMAFFAIVNPIANAPLFVSLTEGLDSSTRRTVALRAVGLAYAIAAAFALFGQAIFHVFGITLPAFRIAGGILVGLVGYHLVQGKESSIHTPTPEDNERSREAALGIAVSPLALPILAGPGTIATAINFAADATWPAMARILGALGIVFVITWVTFLGSESLVKFLGQNAIKVVTRLMGLILAVIGTQMLITGIRGAVGGS